VTVRSFIFWTGLISVLAGAGLQFPIVAATLMPKEQPGMLLHMFGLMAIFLGVMLVISSRDLAHRAPMVVWEGILRTGGFLVMTGYGLWGGGGYLMIGSGFFDLVIGVAYIVWLPRHLGVSASALLLDNCEIPTRA
jgi:hypothetical protein